MIKKIDYEREKHVLNVFKLYHYLILLIILRRALFLTGMVK
jgi:hypothetical protein